MYLDNVRADALLMDMELEIYSNDELGKDGHEEDGCKSSVCSRRELTPCVRVSEYVASECKDESCGLDGIPR